MYLKILQYIIVFLILTYVCSCGNMSCKNEIIFIVLGLLIYHFYRNVLTESFDACDDQACESTINGTNSDEKKEEYRLSDLEVLNHVNFIIKNIGSKKALEEIYQAINKEQNSDKRAQLLALYEMAIIDPDLTSKVASGSAQHALATAFMVSENPEIINAFKGSLPVGPSSKPVPKANKESDIKPVKKLSEEQKMDTLLKELRDIKDTLQGKNKETVPEFLQKLMAQNKYIDNNGLIKNALRGDMKYSQLDPSAYQPPVNPSEDDKWDHSEYSILPPSVWRPRVQTDIYDQFQETKCPVCPMMTSYPVALKEWDDSRYVMGSDNISIDYVKELNRKKI